MQSAAAILMIRPVSFCYNKQTAESNAFQQQTVNGQHIQDEALAEFDALVSTLRENGVDVLVVDDTVQPHKPDSIFPNNWVSFHQDGSVYLYPMQAENRRTERRDDIIAIVNRRFNITQVTDLSFYEQQGRFLEGTGSLVLDRGNKIAYACLSPRTDIEVVHDFCSRSGYRPILFNAVDGNGKAIYHTNVLMCIGDQFVVICLETIADEGEKQVLKNSFKDTHKEVVEISLDQMNNFAGNMLQLKNNKGENLLVMSARAYHSLEKTQVGKLEKYAKMIYADLTTIENNGGGSARCMIAEIHLTGL